MAGRVTKTLAERLWRRVRKTRGCWLWTGAVKENGYGVIGETRAGRMIGVHVVSWELTNGPVPDGLCVLHECDVRNCVRPSHLFLGTNADNTRDMYDKGRAPVGERHGCAKLRAMDVRHIRRRKAEGETQRQLAEAFGVSQPLINNIVHYKVWRHVRA